MKDTLRKSSRIVLTNFIASYGIYKDEIEGLNLETGVFHLNEVGRSILFRLYKEDINNDNQDEYILVGNSGPGEWLDTEAISAERD